jgi:vitamin B12 transporter
MSITLFLYLFFQATSSQNPARTTEPAGPVQALQIKGTVSDPAGRPVEGAQVACGTEIHSTDLSGAFEMPSACEATITKPGFAPLKVALSSTGNAITLALAPSSDRVIVTATGAPLTLDEAGVAATVFTSADFAPPNAPFVEDLLRDVPGLNIVQTGQSGALTSLFVRGGDYDATLVLLDGVPITEPGGSIDFANITSAGLDRMEVIRGPESALFGAEASSGVIQLFTKRGDSDSDTPHGSATYDRGSFSTDHWSGTIDGGLAKRLDYAFTADQLRSTGEFPNDAHRVTSGTANLGFRFSDHTQLRAVFREFDAYTGDPGQVAYGLVDYLANERVRDSTVSVRLDDQRGRHFVQHLQFGYHRYRDIFMDSSTQTDNVAAILRTVPGPTYPYTYLVALANPNIQTAPPGTFFVETPYEFFPSTSLELTSRENVSYQGTLTHGTQKRGHGALVFGYEYERQAGVLSPLNVSRYDNGFFVNEQYSLTSRISITAGARLQQSSTFGTEFTPRAAVSFRLPTDTYLRVSGGRGIKEPELIENFANTSFYVGNPNLKPETTDSFEVGLFREWFGRRVRTEASYFRNSFKDLIEYDSDVNPNTWVNIDRAWARGAEFSGTAKLVSFLSVRAAYTKLYTLVTNDADPTQIGLPLVRRPRNSGSVSFELAPKRWTFAAGARFVGERQDDDFVFYLINRLPGYAVVFADASWRATRHLMPFIRVNNLMNADYQEVLGYPALSRNGSVGVRVTW